MWIREVPGGLHQCIQCLQVVTAKDVYPKLEDLPENLRYQWEAHEATRARPALPTPPTPAATPPASAPSRDGDAPQPGSSPPDRTR